MRIRKFGHACLQVTDGDANVLIDPGTFSSGYAGLTGLTAVLVTHAHADHLDTDGVAGLLEHNPQAHVYADTASERALADAGVDTGRVTGVLPGDEIDVGVPVEVSGGEHAVIHAELPTVPNVCFRIAGRLFHPGDSLVVPDAPIEVLALPVAAPWMAVKEAIDYVRAVRPTRAVPIHEKVLAVPAMAYRLIDQLAPEGTEWLEIDDGRAVEV